MVAVAPERSPQRDIRKEILREAAAAQNPVARELRERPLPASPVAGRRRTTDRIPRLADHAPGHSTLAANPRGFAVLDLDAPTGNAYEEAMGTSSRKARAHDKHVQTAIRVVVRAPNKQ